MSEKPAVSLRERVQENRVAFWAGVFLAAAPVVFCVLMPLFGGVKNILAEAGAVSLGLLIGMFVGFFVQEKDKWDQHALSSAALVLTGGGALALMRVVGSGTNEIWFYPIGLLAGFGLGTIWEVLDPPAHT